MNSDFFSRFVLEHRELAEEMLQAGEFSAAEAHEVELVFLKHGVEEIKRKDTDAGSGIS